MNQDSIWSLTNLNKYSQIIALQITIEHNDLEADEVNIISGALELRKKSVEDIMTRLEDIFMLPLEGTLDFEMLNDIRKQGIICCVVLRSIDIIHYSSWLKFHYAIN